MNMAEAREYSELLAFVELSEKIERTNEKLNIKLDNFRTGFNDDVENVHERINGLTEKIHESTRTTENALLELISAISSLTAQHKDTARQLIDVHHAKCKEEREAEKDKETGTEKNKRDNRTKIIIALLGVISTIVALILPKIV